ncbi:DUF6622 family protein [Devosia epidermidihirudinis]|uniref:DUF6622 family protein n=1 Tax=Devosia epidermidihirudinis TaxID=1293439 RepID=UPI000697796D|nr:DUF6622 family protein [Devosia epidermidihirudinis]
MDQTTPTIFDIVSHTPSWVWIILALLIWRGIKQMQPREVGIRGLVLFPLLLMALSAYTILSSGLSMAVIAGVGLGALGGIAAGLSLERRYPSVPAGRGRLLLAGEWTSLAVILSAFTIRYVKTVAANVSPELLSNGTFQLVTVGISAFFGVMLLTRMISRLGVLNGTERVGA